MDGRAETGGRTRRRTPWIRAAARPGGGSVRRGSGAGGRTCPSRTGVDTTGSVARVSSAGCHHAQMAHDVVFFLAPDDKTAAAAYLRGPGEALESVTCHFIEPDSAIAEWDMYFEQPSAEVPPIEQLHGWVWPEWVVAPSNDGVEVFAPPRRLTRSPAHASSAELEELAGRWATRLWSEDGDDMTQDDLPAVLRGVARLAATAVNTGGGLYSWSF
jgi:hypothetical protein